VAATPLASDGFVPFVAPSGGSGPVIDQATGTAIEPVETFDPVARAELLARELPRQWTGTYQSFAAGAPQPVTLNLTAVRAMGAIVDLRGEFQGLQGLELSGWNANRLTDQGGRLALQPGPTRSPASNAGAAMPVRGLW